MGVLRFRVACRDRLPPFVVDTAHVTGFDRTPWQGTTTWRADDVLEHRRGVSESGAFCCPWILASGEWLLLSTATLREGDTTYELERELARGTVSRVRELKSQMDIAGCQVSTAAAAELKKAQSAFVDHVSLGRVETAIEAIERACSAIRLCMADLQQFQRKRRQEKDGPEAPLRMGVLAEAFGSDQVEAEFLAAFDTVSIAVNWRLVEQEDGKYDWRSIDRWVGWAASQGRRICMGPLLKLEPGWVPDWVFLLRDRRIEVLYDVVHDFISAVVARYGAQVDLWSCAAGLNVPGALSLLSEERLRLAVTAIEAINRSDQQRKPIVMRFAQPWSEALIRNEMELPSFHFADALVRANLGLCGIGVDIQWGTWPHGTLHRDPLAVHMMLQRWSALELPLLVGLAIPAAPTTPGGRTVVLGGGNCREPSPESQAEVLRELISVIRAAPTVHGLAYNSFADSVDDGGLALGLVDSGGHPRPAFKVWKTLEAPASRQTPAAQDSAAT